MILGTLGPKNLYIGDITGRKHFLHKVRTVSRFWALALFSQHAIQALAHNCRDLQDVTIACDMTDVGLIALARCPLLLHVDLGTPKITDDGIVSLSNIDHLDLRNCNRVSPAAICRVVQCSPTLTYLSFWDCALLTYDIVFFHLYENVEGIIRSRKDLMLNTFDFMDEPRRVPQEVCDELGIQLPEPESDY